MREVHPRSLGKPGRAERFERMEEEGYSNGFQFVAGLDEVGRGPLAGPVVAVAVILPREFNPPDIKDSKLLTAKQRLALAPVIREAAVSWSIGVVEAEEIDRINILKASLLAMAYAVKGLVRMPDYLLIDGIHKIPGEFLEWSDSVSSAPPLQKTIIKGDRRCVSIAAASILAKIARDEIMIGLDKNYPGYGFGQHKGYGSAAHLAALRRLGPSAIHRKSFKPVRDVCAGGERAVGSLFVER